MSALRIADLCRPAHPSATPALLCLPALPPPVVFLHCPRPSLRPSFPPSPSLAPFSVLSSLHPCLWGGRVGGCCGCDICGEMVAPLGEYDYLPMGPDTPALLDPVLGARMGVPICDNENLWPKQPSGPVGFLTCGKIARGPSILNPLGPNAWRIGEVNNGSDTELKFKTIMADR